MIDVNSERLITLSEAAAWLPSRPNAETLNRWCLRGLRGVKLESVFIGRRYTTLEAMGRFGERLAGRRNRQLDVAEGAAT